MILRQATSVNLRTSNVVPLDAGDGDWALLTDCVLCVASGAVEVRTGIQEFRADAVVEPDAARDLLHVGAPPSPRRGGKCLEPVSKSPEEDNEAGELDETEEVLGVVFPPDQDAALPLDPGEEALDEPASHVAA